MEEEKIVIPSNEEVLEVKAEGDCVEIEDVGNKKSAEILENKAGEL
jgi:hypothetical protein